MSLKFRFTHFLLSLQFEIAVKPDDIALLTRRNNRWGFEHNGMSL